MSKMSCASTLLCLCFIVASACASVVAENERESVHSLTDVPEDGPTTVTPAGRIRGLWMETRRSRRFQAYRGIRYAEPPIGELRFQPPKPIVQYTAEVDATEDGPACPQPARRGYHVDEDCLTINVYTPGNGSKLLPVIFYIHSGGFYSMSGRSDLAGPHYLLDRDLVLVTINYRLATLGFLSTGDEIAPGNNGMKDQVVALKWVQRNIASFGGNPNLVTIAGCSAGSNSVMDHMLSPMSKGLFHRAISISGGPSSKAPTPNHQLHLAVKQAQLLKCPTNSSKAIVDCLKTKSWREFANSLGNMAEFGYDPVRLWEPVVELDFGQERFLTEDPVDAIRQKKMHAVPFIVSQTRDEFFWKAFTILNNATLLSTMNTEWDRVAPISFMVPRNNSKEKVERLRQVYLDGKALTNDSKSAENLGKLYADAITGFPVHRMANLMCRHSPQPVWYYEFAYIGNHSFYQNANGRPIRVAHHDDLIYLFTLSLRFPSIPLDSPDSAMVDRMTAIFYNFARYGDPDRAGTFPALSDTPSWPRMTPQHRQYLILGSQVGVGSKLKEDRFKVWDELYPIQYD